MKFKISKSFDDNGIKKILFENLEIEIDETKITSIVAPLNSGKSTLLKILGGILQADERIPKVNYSFLITENPMSLPWMNLRQTLLFADKNLDENKLKEISQLVGLDGYEDHLPNNKSLGFRFRIVLAAALVKNSELILIDESFQNMEQITKLELYKIILELNKKLGIGFIIGTSNLSEAILLSDEIILLKNYPHNSCYKIAINHSTLIVEERINSYEYFSNKEKFIKEINNQEFYKSFNYIL